MKIQDYTTAVKRYANRVEHLSQIEIDEEFKSIKKMLSCIQVGQEDEYELRVANELLNSAHVRGADISAKERGGEAAMRNVLFQKRWKD